MGLSIFESLKAPSLEVIRENSTPYKRNWQRFNHTMVTSHNFCLTATTLKEDIFLISIKPIPLNHLQEH